MYSKDELLSKDISELEEIAEKVGAKIKSGETQEEIIYSIPVDIAFEYSSVCGPED